MGVSAFDKNTSMQYLSVTFLKCIVGITGNKRPEKYFLESCHLNKDLREVMVTHGWGKPSQERTAGANTDC